MSVRNDRADCCEVFIALPTFFANGTSRLRSCARSFVHGSDPLQRSCAMIRPDLRPICENMLMAEGFVKARTLAVKFVTLYSLSSELLSKQVRYDMVSTHG